MTNVSGFDFHSRPPSYCNLPQSHGWCHKTALCSPRGSSSLYIYTPLTLKHTKEMSSLINQTVSLFFICLYSSLLHTQRRTSSSGNFAASARWAYLASDCLVFQFQMTLRRSAREMSGSSIARCHRKREFPSRIDLSRSSNSLPTFFF